MADFTMPFQTSAVYFSAMSHQMWEAVDLEALLCIPNPGVGGVVLGGKLTNHYCSRKVRVIGQRVARGSGQDTVSSWEKTPSLLEHHVEYISSVLSGPGVEDDSFPRVEIAHIQDYNLICQLIRSCLRSGCGNADFDNKSKYIINNKYLKLYFLTYF